jgi:hypothetical protein
VTTVELRERLVRVRPDVEWLGLEIDPARVSGAIRKIYQHRRSGALREATA